MTDSTVLSSSLIFTIFFSLMRSSFFLSTNYIRILNARSPSSLPKIDRKSHLTNSLTTGNSLIDFFQLRMMLLLSAMWSSFWSIVFIAPAAGGLPTGLQLFFFRSRGGENPSPLRLIELFKSYCFGWKDADWFLTLMMSLIDEAKLVVAIIRLVELNSVKIDEAPSSLNLFATQISLSIT